VIALGKSAVVDLRIPAAADEYGVSDRA
jgi:hypothetical protein